jgi:uncharacterized protein (TIGR00255 family)
MTAAQAEIYSMTGYATVRVDVDETVSFTLTLKSVNHRFLDLQVRLPQSFEGVEAEVRRRLRAGVQRGHVEFSVQLERQGKSGLAFNDEQIAGYVAAFRKVAERHGLSCEPDLNDVLRLPGMMSGQQAVSVEDAAALEQAVLANIDGAIAKFNASRAAEGAALAAELRASMGRIDALAAEVSELRSGARAAEFDRLKTRMAELIDGAAAEDERLLVEAALLADKSDIDEELVRLRTHAAGFVALLEEGGPVGKRLDFLLQELNREANTLLSKTGGAGSRNGLRITELGLEMKVEIERAREQIQNLE